MTMEPTEEYAKKCMELANEMLIDAKDFLGLKRLRSSIDRAYCAMFHAAQAALAFNKIKPAKTHDGLRMQFGKHLIKTGLVDKRLGRDFTKAFKMRQLSTYEVYAVFGEEGVKEVVQKAEAFILKIKELLSLK